MQSPRQTSLPQNRISNTSNFSTVETQQQQKLESRQHICSRVKYSQGQVQPSPRTALATSLKSKKLHGKLEKARKVNTGKSWSAGALKPQFTAPDGGGKRKKKKGKNASESTSSAIGKLQSIDT